MNQLVKTEETEETNVLGIIAEVAANPQANPDVMERLLDMQERVLDRNAKQAFNSAFVRCQSTMPSVVKDTANQQTNSSYAKLETINKYLLPHITSCGFGLSFGTSDSPLDNHIRVTAELIHTEGHCKEYLYDSPHDGEGIKGNTNKTPAHARSSALTYGQRYLTTIIFNVIVMKDDDGNGANSNFAYSEHDWDMFNELVSEKNPNPLGFAAFDNRMSDLIGGMRARYLAPHRVTRTISKETERLRDLVTAGHKEAGNYADQMADFAEHNDLQSIEQLAAELTQDEKIIVFAHMDGDARHKIEQLKKEAA